MTASAAANEPTVTAFPGVRVAVPSDEAAVYSMLTLLHQENGLAPMSPPKVLGMIRHCLHGHGGIIGVIDGKNEIEATIGLSISQWWYTDASHSHLEEIWNFVHPDYRRSTHSKNLLLFAKWASERLGLPLLTGVLTVKRLEPKLRLMQRQSRQIGALFLTGPTPVDAFNQKKVALSCAKSDVENARRADSGQRPLLRAPDVQGRLQQQRR